VVIASATSAGSPITPSKGATCIVNHDVAPKLSRTLITIIVGIMTLNSSNDTIYMSLIKLLILFLSKFVMGDLNISIDREPILYTFR
jgi:hypothetical protein